MCPTANGLHLTRKFTISGRVWHAGQRLTFPDMILPTTYAAALILLILSMVCWDSWANALKLVGERWRFELFYFDYSFGVLAASVVAAFTFGTLGADMTFQDRLLVAGH